MKKLLAFLPTGLLSLLVPFTHSHLEATILLVLAYCGLMIQIICMNELWRNK